jgi:uncharacterized protein
MEPPKPEDSVVDALAFHEWPSLRALAAYLPAGWREVLLRPQDRTGPVNVRTPVLYTNPAGGKLPAAYPESGPPGSSFELLERLLLADGARSQVVLGYDDGVAASAFPNYYLARSVVQAANDWTRAEWLDRDPRLFGLVLVASSLPEDAAAEIRRVGADERFVGVAMGGNGLGRPFGHPVYHPIYEAAAELGLPVVIQAGSDSAADQGTPVAGGLPATFAAYRALSMQSHMSHLASLIVQGVFDLLPDLKVLIVGGGAAWIPGYLWRLDNQYKQIDQEAPWLKRLPSEHFLHHVRVATHSLEAPPGGALGRLLEALPGAERLLVYASCFPDSDSEAPEAVASRLPAAWRERVLRQNALELFRWPSRVRSGDQEVGSGRL